MEYDITVLSIFRDSTTYLDRYIAQLRGALVQFEYPHLIWVEGDSTDGTAERLRELADELDVDVTLVQCDTGGPYWPSVDHPDRWKQLESVWNTALKYLLPSTRCVCLESDLIWEPEALWALVEDVERGWRAVGPMLKRGTIFYDTNGFQANGQHFTNNYPYHPILAPSDEPTSPVRNVDTVGGMVVCRYEALKEAVWRDKCVLHFVPGKVQVGLDTEVTIYHP